MSRREGRSDYLLKQKWMNDWMEMDGNSKTLSFDWTSFIDSSLRRISYSRMVGGGSGDNDNRILQLKLLW